MQNLRNKTALVTGAANGIGRATVDRFLIEGATVIAVDRITEPDPPSGAARWVQGDVTDPAVVNAAVQAACEVGRLDICVANAGISHLEEFVAGSPTSWRPILEVNLLGVMITLREAAEVMVADGRGGRLLATASIAGLHGEPLSAAYSASKGGVLALTRALAVELADRSITVNAVAPGQIDTEMNRGDAQLISIRQGKAFEEYQADFLAAHVPVGRLGVPDEVAALFAFLASDDAAFITGATFRIDGAELAI